MTRLTHIIIVCLLVSGQSLPVSASSEPIELFNLQDQETKSIWNIKGEAVSGPMKGQRLKQIPAHNAMWFAWLAFWGNTQVHGETERGDGQTFENVNLFPSGQIVSGGVPRDGIPALTDPKMLAPFEAKMSDSDLVFGVVMNGEARAYPHAIGWWHEIVNDRVGGHPVVVTFCPLTGTGLVFDGDGGEGSKRVELGVSGLLFNTNLIMYDRRDGDTLYPQMIFKPINDNEVAELKLLPVIETTWGLWKQLYPNTLVVSDETGFFRNYTAYPYGAYRETSQVFFPLAQDRNNLSSLHHPKERVLGVRGESGTPKAYPFAAMGGDQAAINDTIDNNPILVVYYGEGRLAIPYSREVDGQTLTFEIAGPNLPPEFSSLTDREVAEGGTLMFQVRATDPDGDPVTVTALGLPEGATFEDGEVVWSPGFDRSGVYRITFTASDGSLNTAEEITISVLETNAPVRFSSITPSVYVLVEEAESVRHFEISTTDPDNDPLAITWKVNGEEVVGETGPAFTFTATDAESDVVSVEVSDGTETIEHRWRIARALRGDFDDNGIVDLIDFFLFAGAFGQDGVGELARFNLDENSEINFFDFFIFASWFGVKTRGS